MIIAMFIIHQKINHFYKNTEHKLRLIHDFTKLAGVNDCGKIIIIIIY